MSDKAAETKETQAVSTPEKEKKEKKEEVVCERKPVAADKESKEEKKAGDKPEQNGHSKTEESAEEKPVENGEPADDVCPLPQKRKSEAGSGESTEKSAEGASPEKKAKIEEKVENGEAQATA